MAPNDLIAGILKGNLGMLQGVLGDFNDADMFVRPCAGANHAAWQLGHLTRAENAMTNGIKPGSGAALPAGYIEKFVKDASKIDDPASFGVSKAELVANFTAVRTASIALAKSLSADDLDKPSPPQFASFAGTVGELLAAMSGHATMHLGQFQVIRRKLGKAVLF